MLTLEVALLALSNATKLQAKAAIAAALITRKGKGAADKVDIARDTNEILGAL